MTALALLLGSAFLFVGGMALGSWLDRRRLIDGRIQDRISKNTTAKANAKPPAKIHTRIISDKPFVLLRGA